MPRVTRQWPRGMRRKGKLRGGGESRPAVKADKRRVQVVSG